MSRIWIGKLFGSPKLTIVRPKSSRKRDPMRLGVESLECRDVPAFLAPTSFNAGFTVSAATTADMNGDGKMDIVSVGNISGKGVVSVSMNNGDGTYTQGRQYYTGNSPVAVKVGDFDGDGKQDIVTLAAYYTGALTTLNGNGDGSFQPYVSYTVLTPPTDVEVRDVNGDGHPDLVAVNDYFSTLSVFTNTGLGKFGPKVDYAAGSQPWSVGTADFNGDGKADAVATNLSGTAGGLGFFAGNGTGGFGARVGVAIGAGTGASALTIGDFNGDGKQDVAVASTSGSTTVNVLLGNGDGTFQTGVNYNVGYIPIDIKQGDFNHDGKIDLVERTTAGYVIEAGNGDGTFQPAIIAAGGAGNSSLIADFNGDGATDIASTSAGTVIVQINANTGLSPAIAGAGFTISAPTTTPAGVPVPVTIRAVDANGAIVPTFTGTITVSTSGPLGSSTSYAFTSADAGVLTVSIPVYSVGAQTITASAPLLSSASQSITVTAAPANRLAVTALPNAVAGSPTTFMVVATDMFGNMVANYTGTAHFTSSDPQADLPADYTYTAADGGSHTFTGTLKTAGNQVFKAADTAALSLIGNSNGVLVTPIEGVSLSTSGGGGFIGVAHAVTVNARDIYGNVATSYNGTAHLTSSNPNTIVGADAVIVNGAGTITITPMTLGTQTLTVTGALLGASASITVTPGWPVRFTMTAIPATIAGVGQSFSVTAFDAFGNVSNVYTGIVVFSSSDIQAGLPASYAFTAADAGSHTFSVALRTAGLQSFTMRDSILAAVTVTQSGIAVGSAAPVSISVTALHGVVAGTAQTVTVSGKDAFGNIATAYRGTIAFGSSDLLAGLPANYTFTAADAGTHDFSVVLKTSGLSVVTVQDTANATNPSYNFMQRDIPVTPSAAVGFALRAPSNVTANVAFLFTVQAVDAFGNVVNGYRGKVHFTGPSGVPLDYTFTAADAGKHVFSITLTATGTQTIGIQDTLNGAMKAQTSVNVVAQSTGGGGTGGGGTGGGGKRP